MNAYSSGRYEEALNLIQQCIDQDSTNYKYIFLKGKTLENLYRYSEAIATQQKALHTNPGSIEAKSALAALYQLSGQPAASAHLYEQLVLAEPQVTRWKINLSIALQSAGKPKDALVHWMAVVQEDSTNWLVYKNMGDCYYREDSLELAVYHYQKSLCFYPNNKNLFGTLTRILANTGWTEEAITTGIEAVTTDSTNVEAWKYLGVAYYQYGNDTLSYEAFSKALALGDSSKITCNHFGMLNYYKANYFDAEKYLYKALLQDPNSFNIRYYLSVTYGYTGKSEKGLKMLDDLDKMIANIDTIGMQANIQRGYLLRRLYQYDDAAGAFISSTVHFPKNTRNFYEAGVCYDMAHNKKKALDWYTRFLDKTDPNWADRSWTETELKNLEFVRIAMERINWLKTELFFEAKK